MYMIGNPYPNKWLSNSSKEENGKIITALSIIPKKLTQQKLEENLKNNKYNPLKNFPTALLKEIKPQIKKEEHKISLL